MTMIKKTLVAGFATLALAGAMTVTTSSEAEARWRYRHGAFAAGVVGALALGAIAASAAQPRYVGVCYRKRQMVWDDFYGAYVPRRVTVCG